MGDYVDFALTLIFWVGITFELPLVMFFLARFNLVSARQFAKQWRYAIVIIAVVAAVITPTVDLFNMTLVALPMLGLYALGILFACRSSPRIQSPRRFQNNPGLSKSGAARVFSSPCPSFFTPLLSAPGTSYVSCDGDSIDWLALADTFALYLFVPLVLLVALVVATRRYALLLILAAPCVLFLVLFGAQFFPPPSLLDSTQPALRVMTFNLNGNSPHPELAIEHVASENPDIALVQE